MGEGQAALGKDQEVQLAEGAVALGHEVEHRTDAGPLRGRIGDDVALVPAHQMVGDLGEQAMGVLPDGQAELQRGVDDFQHGGADYP